MNKLQKITIPIAAIFLTAIAIICLDYQANGVNTVYSYVAGYTLGATVIFTVAMAFYNSYQDGRK